MPAGDRPGPPRTGPMRRRPEDGPGALA